MKEIVEEIERLCRVLKENYGDDVEIRSSTNNYELPLPNACSGIKKEHAWIVWTSNKNGNITDLQVYELDRTIPWRWEKTIEFVDRRKIPYKDIGAVSSDWEKWTFKDICQKLVDYGFSEDFSLGLLIQRLYTIEGFKEWWEGEKQV